MSNEKFYAVNLQNADWGDDGGDHDPFLVALSDADYAAIVSQTVVRYCQDEDDLAELVEEYGAPPEAVAASRVLMEKIRWAAPFISNEHPQRTHQPSFPVTIHDCFAIWTN